MRMIVMLVAVAAGLAALSLPASAPILAQSAAALSGRVSSAREGLTEGVVVSAKRDGSTITVSVVSDDKGRFSFPAARLDPGHYALSIRAVGYDLDGPKDATVAAGQNTDIDIKLKPTRNLSAQLTNAEWLMSMPGSDDQKRFLLACNSCHTLERIVKSTHDAAEFLQVFQRMAGYYPGSTPLHPQRLAGDAVRNIGKGPAAQKIAEWLASINLSQQDTWSWPLKTLPRLTGKSTHVIITEYDLPNKLIEPHDVVLDREGNVWYSDFGEMFLGEMDAKTGKVTQYPIPLVKPGYSLGTLDLEIDRDDNPWIGLMYQSAIAKFDRKTGKFEIWSTPKEWDSDAGQLGHLAVEGTPTDDKVWIKNSAGGHIYRLDLASNKFEDLGSPKDPRTGKRIGTYGIYSDVREQSLSARLLRRQHRADRRQDHGADGLSDADAELASAAWARRRPGPALVRRVFRRRHRHARSEDRQDRGMESADAVVIALRRGVRPQRRCLDRLDEHRSCRPPRRQDRAVHRISAAASDQHSPRLCRRFEKPRDAVDRQQSRRFDRQGRAAGLGVSSSAKADDPVI